MALAFGVHGREIQNGTDLGLLAGTGKEVKVFFSAVQLSGKAESFKQSGARCLICGVITQMSGKRFKRLPDLTCFDELSSWVSHIRSAYWL